ncbi:MAG: bis(5'-nucleosyl)-tetraphosphatase (symmetrical) YqeK [Hydrogenibacillus schlegelii]|uniref:bis(5'-nucleosyl)-tetraphosphatase (symmetrical) n=1 Tax=Hydrogenibacillus schlegelii TaxID=1484 RepID=A0A947D140_HYDSH|nr:bis(5'-nucleosyl)-tetraphosphatase (symmetrical) YqeK [Hydrogenibacillus schlegelii]
MEGLLAAIDADLRAELSPKRYRHVLDVAETARTLAPRAGVPEEEAVLAALLHDRCREWPKAELEAVLRRYRDVVWLDYAPVIWHGPVASYVARERYGIENVRVLEAIYYHTTGRGAMSSLDLVLWVADYIEPGRTFPEADVARKLAETDLEAAFRYGLSRSLIELIERGEKIHPAMWQAYNAIAGRRA